MVRKGSSVRQRAPLKIDSAFRDSSKTRAHNDIDSKQVQMPRLYSTFSSSRLDACSPPHPSMPRSPLSTPKSRIYAGDSTILLCLT